MLVEMYGMLMMPQLVLHYGVTVTTSHQLLGGVVGDQSGSAEYVKGCVTEWSMIIQKLVLIVKLSLNCPILPIQGQYSLSEHICRELFLNVALF